MYEFIFWTLMVIDIIILLVAITIWIGAGYMVQAM